MQKKGGLTADIVVIAAGMVGSAIAYGLAKHHLHVLVLDGGDLDVRAASANFGLVWSQGKGLGMPAYQQLTRDSVDRWPDFSTELTDNTNIDLQYERNGGLTICLGEAEFESQHAELLQLQNQLGSGERDWEMIDRNSLAKLLPKVQPGPDVVGASFGRRDGHTNPLRLLAALHAGILRRRGQLLGGSIVHSVQTDGRGGFTIDFASERASQPARASAARVVIAAGLGSQPLAAQVGLDIPIRPQRGQILVTERIEPALPLPMSGLRQTREGTVMIGATHEEVGFDTSTTSAAAAALSARAIRCIPALTGATVVRQWAALRILTPDGHPIYTQSQSHPGVFVALCHSGVTLAPLHSTVLADAIAAGQLPTSLDVFHPRRFDVPQAA